jgi:hypothetical protein
MYADTALMATTLEVLTVAGAFHYFIIRRCEDLAEDDIGVRVGI